MSHYTCSSSNSRVQFFLDSLSEEDISSILSSSVEDLSNNKDNIEEGGLSKTTDPAHLAVFQTKTQVPMKDYLKCILRYAEIEKSTLILAFILLDKANLRVSSMLNSSTSLKLFIGALICAIKYNQDKIFSNKVYAKICGVSLQTFNLIETRFLELINYSVHVRLETWTEYLEYLYKIKYTQEKNLSSNMLLDL
mmetsp:Transcript_6325/g.6577  ORF Transcript_6325/g.6577 Transcript_6325/m.6577 type:complete len:194 (+) Transcript_6325:13-594(+)